MINFPRGRELILGVSAGISAYKSCELLRRLQDQGFLVTVIPTQSSLNFVGKATWEALSGRAVKSEVWEGATAVDHVAMADQADLVVIAPATADLIARIANGRADDLLTTTVLATSAPIIMVPSMHPGMWLNRATQSNVQILRERGMTVIDPDTGRLTGKDSGVGRYPEVARIVDVVLSQSGRQGFLQGKRIVVTTGGTVEPIDAVRFIGNRSSGRQGLAVAYEALREGAEVTVIAGATEEFSLPGINLLKVESAAQMQEAMQQTFPTADALVMAAAVADARPLRRKDGKIEKSHLKSIELIENPDLLAEISQQRRANQIVVGFAAETEGDLLERGRRKMHKKGTDLLFATDVSGGAVFGEHQTSGVLITKRGEDFQFQGADKHDVARAIVREIARELSSQNG